MLKPGICKNNKQHAIGCHFIHIDVDDNQLTVSRTAGGRGGVRDQFIAARTGIPLWSTKASIRIVREIEHYDVVSPGIPADKFADIYHKEWTKQALKTWEEATESYLVEVKAYSHSQRRNKFILGCQHVNYNGKTWRSGTA